MNRSLFIFTFVALAGLSLKTGKKNEIRQMERLDRGIVAVRTSPEGVFISWRLLATDPEDIGFNLYRGDIKLNKKTLTETTCYTDSASVDYVYKVKAVIKGREQGEISSCIVWKDGFLRIPLNRPPGGEMERDYIPPERRQSQPRQQATADSPVPPAQISQQQNRRQYSYSPGDAGAGDLDGDGQYEIVLKWDPSNARDNAQDGFTANVIIDAYETDGTQLWRIDLGRNIRAGAHYTQFLVFDFDGDGRAEVVCKTADGTVDGKGKAIGNRDANYVNEKGRILTGPEYLTVFNGLTGEAMQTVDYVPGRGNVCGWGANECNGNRVDRFLACVAYLDGKQPSFVMCRGYYGRTTLAAWDWRNGKLTMRWLFDSDKGYPEFMGQGNHNLSVADVDGDGKDEIIYGSCAFDDDGTPLYTTGMGHGDAMHLSDLDPDLPGLELWAVKETGGWGSVLHSAADGKVLFRIPDTTDVGRGLAADIYHNHRGCEVWSSGSRGIYTVKGEKITSAVPSINFRIYWDGDLQDELLDRSYIDDWGYVNHKPVRLLDASKYGGASINGTKATPVLSADILGDWREEVIFRSTDNNSLLLFSTGIPTPYRIPVLMHDPVYRLCVAWQNVVYNQPPHTGFYMGDVIK